MLIKHINIKKYGLKNQRDNRRVKTLALHIVNPFYPPLSRVPGVSPEYNYVWTNPIPPK